MIADLHSPLSLAHLPPHRQVRMHAFLFPVTCLAVAAVRAVCAAANFVNVTSTAVPGSGGSLPGAKAAWADYNNDGYVDLDLGSKLLRNNGNGTFSSSVVNHGEAIWGDYDNDGYVDIFDYSSGRLWRNNHGSGFPVVTTLPGMPVNSRGATWSDFNHDGYLDLYVGGYEEFPTATYADVIYTNNRNGTFTKTWTEGLDGVTTPGRPRPARGITSADWDQDGDMDVYVSNYRLEPNTLLQNDGAGTFTDVASAKNALATSPGYSGGHSIGAVWGDFNNDGLIDLFAGNFAHNDASRPNQPQSRFLMNRGPAAGYAFEDKGTGGVFYQESYASPTAGDIDNDGDLDLYFTTVYPIASFGVPNYPILYRNDGNFQFVDITTTWGLPKTGSISTYQAAFADYDNDGYLDLVTDGKLYHNSGGTNHYLKVRFDSDPLRDATAIGTQVRISLNGKTLTRQVEGAVGEGNQNDHTLHFGLGSYTGPLSLQVNWPNGGAQTVNVSGVDQTITIGNPPKPTGVVVITPSSDANDTWIVPGSGGAHSVADGMSTFAPGVGPGGAATGRMGVILLDLSSVANASISQARLALGKVTDFVTPLSLEAYWVDTSIANFPADLSSLTGDIYSSAIKPFEHKFSQLGNATFASNVLPTNTYADLAAADAADLDVLNAARQRPNPKILIIFKATAGARDWGDSGYHDLPPKLILNLGQELVFGDINADLSVDLADFAVMTDPSHWLHDVVVGENGDLNADGFVDLLDFALFKNAYHEFGNGGELPLPNSVGEPNTLILLIGACPVFLLIRLRALFIPGGRFPTTRKNKK